MLTARSLGIPEILSEKVQIYTGDDDMAAGGEADVYRAEYTNEKSHPVQVAIKTIRIHVYGEATKPLLQKAQRKLERELEIWNTLQRQVEPHSNILPLLGLIDSPNGLPSSVSEWCPKTLATHLDDRENQPRRIELMVGLLKGLSHMHKLSIVHGDLKSVNVLVTENGVAKICDFGQSRFLGGNNFDHSGVSDASSKFQATTRYMSPEFFWESKTKPTSFSDIWAFGCIALEILSQLRPYHIIKNDYRVPLAIQQGLVPSVKPEYPNAAGCLNDMLWSVVKRCWYTNPLSRPSSNALLGLIDDLVKRELINPLATTPQRPPLHIDTEPAIWPEGINDFADILTTCDKEQISVQKLANVWIYSARNVTSSASKEQILKLAVKVPRPAGGLGSQNSTKEPFMDALKWAVRERLNIQHENVVEILGIDTSYGKHTGIVLEYCSQGNLVSYKHKMTQEEELYITYMKNILSGLQFLHSMMSPIAHGDLTPHNILVDEKGTLKLSAISFSRLSASLPPTTQTAALTDDAMSARYMSPELLQDDCWPSPESDMWAFGGVAFWIFSGLAPYPEIKDEVQVVSQICRGIAPNGIAQLEHAQELGGIPVALDSPWLTNGVWNLILRCWNQDGKQRIGAAEFLKELNHRSQMSNRVTFLSNNWTIDGLSDLTENVKKPEARGYGPVLGWSQGVWRGVYDWKGSRTVEITLWSWRSTLSQGFFRRSIEITVKGVQDISADRYIYAARQTIKHELLVLKQLQHPNICALLGYDQHNLRTAGVPAIVSEYCSNGTLEEYYQKNYHDLNFESKLHLMQGLTNAVHYLHTMVPEGFIVHGNLSMETVLVDGQGIIKLSNFEYACQYSFADNILEAPVVFAPVLAPVPSRWNPPDFFTGATNAGPSNPTLFADLWSVGCMLVAISNNEIPYAECDFAGAIAQIIAGAKPYAQGGCPNEIWDLANLLWRNPNYERPSITRVKHVLQSL